MKEPKSVDPVKLAQVHVKNGNTMANQGDMPSTTYEKYVAEFKKLQKK